MRTGCPNGFTLVEMLVVISIISILASLLLPTLTKAQSFARSNACSSTERQLHVGLMLYVDDNYGNTVAPWQNSGYCWSDNLCRLKYLPTGATKLTSSAAKNGYLCSMVLDFAADNGISSGWSYGMPTWGGDGVYSSNDKTRNRKLQTFKRPTECVMTADSNILLWSPSNLTPVLCPDSGWPFPVHSAMANIVFLDGHAQSVPVDAGTTSGLDLPANAWIRH